MSENENPRRTGRSDGRGYVYTIKESAYGQLKTLMQRYGKERGLREAPPTADAYLQFLDALREEDRVEVTLTEDDDDGYEPCGTLEDNGAVAASMQLLSVLKTPEYRE
jgi:hypothetical protein